MLFHIIQGVEIFFTRADFHDFIYIVYKDLSITYMTRIQGFLGSFYDGIHRNGAYYESPVGCCLLRRKGIGAFPGGVRDRDRVDRDV